MVREAGEQAGEHEGSGAGRGSVTRALAILAGFADASGDLRLTDIARSAGLSPSTTHRLLSALCDEGFLAQDASSERYRLGPSILVLGQRAAEQAGFDRARPVLSSLAEETGESASLSVRSGRQVLVVMLVPSRHPLRFDHGVGSTIAIHASAMGKVMLAFGADGTVPDGPFERFTARTITSAKKLAAELSEVRRRGWAVNDAERYDGVTGVAAAVLATDGTATAAIGVQGPTARIEALGIARLGETVRAAAGALTG
jgi:IclR family acetate operon transcriptional repressor